MGHSAVGFTNPRAVGLPHWALDGAERIIKAASNEGDIVADLFCGSGVMAEAAHRFDRRWLAWNGGHLAIQTTNKNVEQDRKGLIYAVRLWE